MSEQDHHPSSEEQKKLVMKLQEFGSGLKFDTGKLRWDLLPWEPVEEVVKIMTYGAEKYGANNWQKIDIERYWAALFRHLIAFRKGEEADQESGLSHISHALCNLVFIQWIQYHMPNSDTSLPETTQETPANQHQDQPANHNE